MRITPLSGATALSLRVSALRSQKVREDDDFWEICRDSFEEQRGSTEGLIRNIPSVLRKLGGVIISLTIDRELFFL